jgi:hypothetical protein
MKNDIMEYNDIRNISLKIEYQAGRQWLMPVILGKKPSQKRTGRVAQGEDPEFKEQYCKKEKRKKKSFWFF